MFTIFHNYPDFSSRTLNRPVCILEERKELQKHMKHIQLMSEHIPDEHIQYALRPSCM